MQIDDSGSTADITRLAVLDAVIAGMDRRNDVIKAAYEAVNRSEFIARLQDLFGIETPLAVAIGDLQIFRLNAEDRDRIEQERLGLRARIHARQSHPPA